ncbi:MAG TPA: hypothetical protein VFP34_01845, partial [Microlunatus sp.]|nr:hypothetical protein [Microlunatus sp.]
FGADQPALVQLLFRPVVPGFHPSERAYAPSLEVQRRVIEAFKIAADSGELHAAAATEQGIRLFIAIVAGVGNERAANQPNLTDEEDLHNLLDPALDMYAAYFSPTQPDDWTPWSTQPTT